jgi:hypothetical protein
MVTRARFEIGGRSRFPRTHRLGLHVGCADGQTTKLFADRSQFRPQLLLRSWASLRAFSVTLGMRSGDPGAIRTRDPQLRRLENFREFRFIYKGLRKFLRRRKWLGLTGVDPSSEENCDLAKSSRHIPQRHATLADPQALALG